MIDRVWSANLVRISYAYCDAYACLCCCLKKNICAHERYKSLLLTSYGYFKKN